MIAVTQPLTRPLATLSPLRGARGNIGAWLLYAKGHALPRSPSPRVSGERVARGRVRGASLEAAKTAKDLVQDHGHASEILRRLRSSEVVKKSSRGAAISTQPSA